MTLCDIICKSFLPCCVYLLLFAFNISMIVIGSVYANDCSLNPLIPIFLIVFGCFSVIQTCCGMSKMICCRENEDESDTNRLCRKTNFCFQGLIVIFLFAWFIAGNVFVFGSWGDWDDSDKYGDYYCNPVLMYFSLITIIVMYAISALVCCCCLCCLCCLVLMAGASDEY
ncbi:PREDICTED: uncharacterized protein LOC109591914 [Amphimedon queenslandica]|uniref:Uncharacterized protein n=2 Tax=Amphimedon queenslandica TaxID=400682 RepID=A0AAN0K147_AMPQE|nr:PREDICTED: uncharacterized protein LOC109591914 [Amphimedon queenslandica]|eukprot:XP_019863073.1 PREDICTED: uncharacterized protein LOC109591914 [Amphimedon queenslandica]